MFTCADKVVEGAVMIQVHIGSVEGGAGAPGPAMGAGGLTRPVLALETVCLKYDKTWLDLSKRGLQNFTYL